MALLTDAWHSQRSCTGGRRNASHEPSDSGSSFGYRIQGRTSSPKASVTALCSHDEPPTFTECVPELHPKQPTTQKTKPTKKTTQPPKRENAQQRNAKTPL